MKTIYALEVKVLAGTNLFDVAEDVVNLVAVTDLSAYFKFNDIRINVEPETTVQDCIDQYYTTIEKIENS